MAPSAPSPAKLFHTAAQSFLLHLTKISVAKKERNSRSQDAAELENLDRSLS